MLKPSKKETNKQNILLEIFKKSEVISEIHQTEQEFKKHKMWGNPYYSCYISSK